MIEIKNVTQIGTPREEDKIYIENLAYARLHEETYQDKRVFVLMGHTERMEGKYATFIEAVIPVKEMEFSGGTPCWNNTVWSRVFKEIKRLYEEMIIVGWVLDARGMQPGMTPDLERIHREHFGGVHQLLFLMDSLEQDETFYIYKENKLIPKDGFFIYYRARKNRHIERTGEIPLKVIDLNKETEDEEMSRNPVAQVEIAGEQELRSLGGARGRYRELLSEQQKKPEKESQNAGLAIAVAMLVFVIVVGAYENRDAFLGGQNTSSTEAGGKVSTETESAYEEESTQASAGSIPVEVVPGTENTTP